MKLYRLSEFSYPSGVHTRNDVYYIDYRTSTEYVKDHYEKGDLIIDLVPDALEYYTGLKSDYFLQVYTMRQVFYDPSESSSRYLERIVGNPVIRDFDDLASVLSSHRKVWVIAAPDSIFMRMSGPEILPYLNREGRVVYESYNAKVVLVEN
jgi:hypothetical protein